MSKTTNNKARLVIVATHPIQYQTPWYRRLAEHNDIQLTVLFGMLPNAEQQSTGFDQSFSWDIPLTHGYAWQELVNASKRPNLSKFGGVDCPSIYSKLNHLQPSAIIITGWHSKLLLQTLFAARRLKIKTIVRGDSNAQRQRSWPVRLIHRLLLTNYDGFLAVGKSNAQFFRNNGVADKKIFDAPYFVENDRFIEQGLTPSDDLEALKPKALNSETLNTKEFCFLYVGKLIEVKNLFEMLDAFAIVYAMHSNIRLLVVGDGELRSQLEAKATKLKLPVSFIGFVNQSKLPLTYSLGDCLVLASDYETWGLVVNEAMACGLPAIVSDRVGCHEDLVIDGETGFVYEYGHTSDLAQKMTLMINQPQQCKAMGKSAQQRILERYNVENSVRATLDVLSYFEQL